MALETATYISQLVATNPPGTDPLAQSDDHLRLIKGVLQAQFPNLGAAAVTPTAAELNYVGGVTSAIQTQLDAKFAKAGGAITGDATISGTLGVTGALSGTTGAFSGSVTGVTESAGDSSTKYATTAYVQGAAFSAALPSQTGNSGKFVTTNGSAASWSLVPLTSGVSGTLPVANGGSGIATAGANVYGPVFAGDTATGAFQVGSPGTANQVLTSNGPSALPTFQTFTVTLADSYVWVNTGNGNGSTSTTIRRYSNLVGSNGSDITRATASTTGDTFTINTTGIYAIEVIDKSVGTAVADNGISVNSAQLTTTIDAISAAARLAFGIGDSSGGHSTYCSWVGRLASGDVIRQHGLGGSSDTTTFASFYIRKVG